MVKITKKEVTITDLAAAFGIGHQAMGIRIRKGWYPSGWTIEKIGRYYFITALLNEEGLFVYKKRKKYVPVPLRYKPSINNKAMHSGST